MIKSSLGAEHQERSGSQGLALIDYAEISTSKLSLDGWLSSPCLVFIIVEVTWEGIQAKRLWMYFMTTNVERRRQTIRSMGIYHKLRLCGDSQSSAQCLQVHTLCTILYRCDGEILFNRMEIFLGRSFMSIFPTTQLAGKIMELIYCNVRLMNQNQTTLNGIPLIQQRMYVSGKDSQCMTNKNIITF